MNYKQAGNSDSGYGGCLLIPFFVLWSIICSGQQTTTVKVNPSKDTTVIKFTTTTTSTTNTQVSYTSVSLPTKDSVVITPPPVDSSAGYSLVFSSGFDTQADFDPDGQSQGGNGYIDNVTFLTGSSFKSRPANISSGVRSEVSYAKHSFPTEGAIEYDAIYNFIITDGCHSLQWHPTSDNGSAVLSLFHTGGKFDVTLSKAGSNYRQSGTSQPMQTIQKGHWYHMRVEYKFASYGAYCRWYIDGKLYYTAPQTFLGDGTGQYLKVGFNGGFWGSQNATLSDINYENLRVYKKL